MLVHRAVVIEGESEDASEGRASSLEGEDLSSAIAGNLEVDRPSEVGEADELARGIGGSVEEVPLDFVLPRFEERGGRYVGAPAELAADFHQVGEVGFGLLSKRYESLSDAAMADATPYSFESVDQTALEGDEFAELCLEKWFDLHWRGA